MVYILIIFVSLVLALVYQKEQEGGIRYFPNYKSTFLCYLPYTVFMAIRWNLGRDTNYNIGHYSVGYSKARLGLNVFDYESGFFAFFRFFSVREVPIFVVYFIISILYMLALCFLIYRLKLNPPISVLAFFGLDMYLFAYAAIRQVCAFSFIFIAFALYFKPLVNKKKNLLLMSLCLFVACTMHITSVLYILLFIFVEFINYFFDIKRNIMLVFSSALILSTPVVQLLITKFLSLTKYDVTAYDSKITEFYILFFGIFLVFCYMYFYGLINENKRNVLFIVSAVISFIVFLCSSKLIHTDRIYQLFTPIYFILICKLIGIIKFRYNKMFYILILFVLFVLNVRMYFIPGNEVYELFKYQTVFSDYENIMNLIGR